MFWTVPEEDYINGLYSNIFNILHPSPYYVVGVGISCFKLFFKELIVFLKCLKNDNLAVARLPEAVQKVLPSLVGAYIQHA